MVIDFTTAERVVAFLNIARLSFDDAESELTGRLSRLLDQHVVLSFSCPLTADQDSELFVTIDSATLATTVEAVSAQSMGDNDPGFMTRVVYFTEFDEDNIKPKIIARFSEPLHQDHIPLVEGLIRSFISSVLRRQYATMRRHIINAKIDSDDLGSFLYRLFRRHEFHRLLGAEAASVFALDHRSAMLHLRGTTGLAADAHMSDQLSCRGRLQRFQRFPSTRAADRLPRRERAAAGQECRAYHGRPVHQGLLAAASEAHIQSQRHHPRGAPLHRSDPAGKPHSRPRRAYAFYMASRVLPDLRGGEPLQCHRVVYRH